MNNHWRQDGPSFQPSKWQTGELFTLPAITDADRREFCAELPRKDGLPTDVDLCRL